MARTLSEEEMAEIDHLFTYHPPTPDQIDRMAILRNRARALAQEIYRCCPRSADRSAAVRLLRETVMTANASIVLEEKREAPENVASPTGYRARMERLSYEGPICRGSLALGTGCGTCVKCQQEKLRMQCVAGS